MSTPGEAIIGETFNSFVKKQIEIRQNKLALNASHNDDFLKYTHSKTAFLRLTSGINVSNSILEKLRIDGIRPIEGLAQAYVISNAQGYDANTDQYVFNQGIGYDVISSYGYTSSPEYGFVPPPGIISATVRSLNRGSLREATINLVCHNVRQLQIIDTLFLKLRYSFLLEWGHTTYFDNSGNLIGPNEVPNMSDAFLQKYNNQYTLLEKIENERENSGGNYDAFWGVLKNFTWELTPNGTYNITLVGISTGDVIESFKINSNVTPTTTYTDENGVNLDKYQSSTLANVLGIVRKFVDQNGTGYIHGYISDENYALQSEYISSTNGNPELKINWLDPNEKSSGETSTVSEKEAIKLETPDLEGEEKAQYFIKLGALLRLIQTFLLSYSNGTPSFKINYSYNNKNNKCLTLLDRLPLDVRVSYIPINPKSKTVASVAIIPNNVSDKFGTDDENIANTMHMYVNINYIIDILENNKDEDSKIDLYKFLTKLMEGIQPSLGSINNFKVIYTHDTNTFSIIDDKIIPYLASTSTSLVNFNTNTLNTFASGGGSFVNNFSIKTELFSKVANTIAMGAQTNGNTGISNSTTFSYLFEGITDRIITYKQNKNTGIKPEDTASQSKYDEAEQDLVIYASNMPGGLSVQAGAYTDSFVNKYTAHVPDLYNYYIGKDTNKSHFVGTGFIPLGCQLNLEGISGIKIYQTFGINSVSLPPVYKDKVKFIVTSIDHKIDDKGWETNIGTLSVPKRNTTKKKTVETPTINITTANTTEKIISTPPPPTTNSNIRNAIVNEAYRYLNLFKQPLSPPPPSYKGFLPPEFETDIKSVGWYPGNETHWCNWFTLLVWRNAYLKVAATDTTIDNVNKTYFNNWGNNNTGRNNGKITPGVPRTWDNMNKINYAQRFVQGSTIFYPGDMITYQRPQYEFGHIGLCVAFDATTRKITTIGGNEGNRVKLRTFNVDNGAEKFMKVSGIITVIER